MRRRRISIVLVLICGLMAAVTGSTSPASAAEVPNGFSVSTIATGFNDPTSFSIAADGTVFVTEKRGRVMSLDSVNDPTPSLIADMRIQVHNNSDRGMTALAVDPDFPAEPYVYVGYTLDKAPFGGTIPTYGSANSNYDPCPNSATIGCPALSRISRLDISNGGAEQVLFEGHCQQFPFHSTGDLVFDEDGFLIASFGDGSTGSFNEYGQRGNPCGDPGGPAGSDLSSPLTEGGHARAQDVLTRTDPTGVHGSILRVDPDNFEAAPNNPMAGDAEANVRAMIGTGFRNPFRLAVDPSNGRLFAGNVGGAGFEEIQLIEDEFVNGGWPCYEGFDIQSNHFWTTTNICQQLAANGGQDVPLFAYTRNDTITPGEDCPTGGLSISGLAINRSGFGDSSMQGGVFFTDYTRACIWYLPEGVDGRPDPSNPQLFATDVGYLTDIAFGPDGSLYGIDIAGEKLIRISDIELADNHPPVAQFVPSVEAGSAPLLVRFDARSSYDPDEGDVLKFRWYYDENGSTDDWGRRVSQTFTEPGEYSVRLEITDQGGLVGSTSHTIVVGAVPTVVVNQPADGQTFEVGSAVPLEASGSDGNGQALPDSAFEWELILHHCIPGGSCHTHGLDAVQGHQGQLQMPDHEYPSYVEARVTATDGDGLSVDQGHEIDYETIDLDVISQPLGVEVLVGSTAETTPFTRVVAQNATTSVSVDPTQTVGGIAYDFGFWSLGGLDWGTNPGIEIVRSSNSVLSANFDSGAVEDDERPSSPRRLYGRPSESGIVLKWQASTDNVGVVEYLVFRSDEQTFGPLLSIVGNLETWTDESAVPGQTYTYAIKARDAAGNTSWRSNLSTRTAIGEADDTERPTTPRGLRSDMSGGVLELSWTQSSDNVGVVGYQVYRSDNGGFGPLLTTVSATDSWSDTEIDVGKTYTYALKAVDAAGNISWRSNLSSELVE